MKSFEELLRLVPESESSSINWCSVEFSKMNAWILRMKATQQNPYWHGEGDVWTHTKMVCETLIQLEAYRALERRKQQILFLTALFHDVGKIVCTRMEDGQWVSPKHTVVGAKMVREFLWKEYGLCGTKELQQFRETICQLIRYHSVPAHAFEQERGDLRLLKIASNGKLLPDFSIELLHLFVEADMKGRIAIDHEKSLELNDLCEVMAEDKNCLKGAATFPDAYSEFACLSGRNVLPGQSLFDDTWGEVVLMSGLPGTGKDTWLEKHLPNCPVVSLDQLRKQMRVSPTGKQGAVIQAAKEQAKEYLRKQQPFVWNATNLTPDIRGQLIEMFVNYHASVRIVYLETDWETQFQRNANRKDEVPENVIEKMLSNLVPPESYEAHCVEWHCV